MVHVFFKSIAIYFIFCLVNIKETVLIYTLAFHLIFLYRKTLRYSFKIINYEPSTLWILYSISLFPRKFRLHDDHTSKLYILKKEKKI